MALNDFVLTLNILQVKRWAFLLFENFSKKLYIRCTLFVISGLRQKFCIDPKYPKKQKGGPFCNIDKFSNERYIRYPLYPEFVISECGKSGMCWVIVEEDSSLNNFW